MPRYSHMCWNVRITTIRYEGVIIVLSPRRKRRIYMAETKRKEREIFPLTLGWEWGCVRVAATLPSIVHVRPSFAK